MICMDNHFVCPIYIYCVLIYIFNTRLHIEHSRTLIISFTHDCISIWAHNFWINTESKINQRHDVESSLIQYCFRSCVHAINIESMMIQHHDVESSLIQNWFRSCVPAINIESMMIQHHDVESSLIQYWFRSCMPAINIESQMIQHHDVESSLIQILIQKLCACDQHWF